MPQRFHPIAIANAKEVLFRRALIGCGVFVFVLVVLAALTLVWQSGLAIRDLGPGFILGRVWDPVARQFGALPFLVGTLLTSILALLIALPFSLALSVFLGEFFKTGWLASILGSAIELLAGIPSVIFGFWGLAVLVPMVQALEIQWGFVPYGVGIFSAALVLAIMIIPFSASLGREVMALVPQDLKDAALSLGATPWEVFRYVIFPYARSGLVSGLFMAFGRAISETMAVTMLIGNANFLPTSLFSPGNTLASSIANEFAEASDPLLRSSLVYLGLVLFMVTTVVTIVSRMVIRRIQVKVQ
jgi:phosphate transport system permease protein